MPNKKRRAAAKKKQKKSFLSFLLSLLGAGKKRPAAKRQQTAAIPQRPQETYRPRPQQSKPALTPGQMAYINARKVTFDHLMQYGHQETDVVCNTQELRDWSVGLYPGQEIPIGSYSAPDRLTDILRYNPYSQFFCVSVRPGKDPIVRVAVNPISVYSALDEADTSFPAIPPNVPPEPDHLGRPTQGLECLEYALRYKPNSRGTKLLQSPKGIYYPRGTRLSLQRYPQGVAVQDGPTFIGFLDFQEEQTVNRHGARNCKCFVDSCTGTDVFVYVLK